MSPRTLVLSLVLTSGMAAAHAAEGLTPPAADSLWPQWRARIALQSTNVSPLSMARLLEGDAPQRGVQGGAVLGDYYFATPSFGSFRASGGLLIGTQGGLPLDPATMNSRLGLSLNNTSLWAPPGADSAGTLPYLGLGFTGAAWRSLAITADVGLVAERPGAASGVGRALFGNQGFDNAWRELRVSPVLQLGMRYTF